VHPQRRDIEQAMVAGEPLRDIARRWRVSKDAVARHKAHVPASLVKARDAKEAARADTLLASIITLRERLERALEGTAVAKDVASLARELRETLRLMLELEGRLRQGAQVQVNVAVATSPEWLTLQARIVAALAPFPEARAAVLHAIEGGEASPSSSRALADHAAATAAVPAVVAVDVEARRQEHETDALTSRDAVKIAAPNGSGEPFSPQEALR